MPAVEMRRSTRVFVPKAKVGGHVKVLRSGRRLWGDPSVKTTLKNDVVLFPLIEDDSDYKPSPPRRRPVPRRRQESAAVVLKPKAEQMEVDEVKKEVQSEVKEKEVKEVCRSEPRVIKNVYSRKRKRNSAVSDSAEREKRKFGLHFVRRKRRKAVESEKVDERKVLDDDDCGFSIVVSGFCGGCSLNSRLLGSVLKYLGYGSVEMVQLSRFLVSKPIGDVFASFGIRFLLNRRSLINRGVCRILGARQMIPLFTVDFSAIPLCFTGLYFGILMRSIRVSCSLKLNFHIVQESTCDSEPLLCSEDRCDQMLNIPIATDRDVRSKKVVVAGLEASKVGSRILQCRNALLTRSPSKRRRRSLRNRRARNPLHFIMQRANGLSVSNNVVFKKNSGQLSMFRDQELRRSARKNPVCELNESKSGSSSVINEPKSSSGSVDMNVDVDSQFCSANVIVVETDRCYRIEGAEVSLDLSAANEWVLSFKKDGVTRYCLKVQKEMRPHSFNRFTHAVMWKAEDGWKLEFPDRKDWVVFKELYKLCDERNLVPTSPAVKNIPVPGVSEVTDFWGSACAFERPESYIRVNSDELSRMLSRRTASYDMDAEDEGWLSEFNSGLDEPSCLSEDTFELMIDAFEKGSYFSLEYVNDEQTAVSHCVGLASSEIALPVFRYWTKKRKQKGVPLLRVFELNEPKRAQLMSKPVLRKKRSLKRTPPSMSFSRGRGKDNSILQAMAVEQTIIEEQHAVLRAQEARASFDKLMEVAIQKRQRAQLLMENADLVTYRATMALRIAAAAAETRLVKPQQAANHFLDNEDVKGS
ncbi:uncharacterized protein LOC141646769 [Silene latifolia]|uniref:uncharacterized protein LOC141646769 n=1 Tax=Silene latifolia TaxID=37657 RepID=UPI003D77F9D6